MNLFKKYLFFVLITLFLSCEKENVNELKSNLSCTINGESFYPRKLTKTSFRIGMSNNEGSGVYSFGLYALNDNDRYKRIQFSMDNTSPIVVGRYVFVEPFFNDNHLDFLSGNCYFEKTGSSSIETPQESNYYTSKMLEGELSIIEIDTINERIKGEFNFQAINNSTNEIINIENGKFDTRLYLED